MSNHTAGSTARSRRRGREFFRTALLAAAIAILWCVMTNRTSLWKWQVPLFYSGDSWAVMAAAKDAAEGHYRPVLPKYNPSLGAPFIANWNDYPVTEDTLIFFMGCLAKVFGLFAACNLAVLIGELLAGVTFYLTCRWWRVAWEWAFAGAMIFTFSTYAFFRSLSHITLSYYWHIPLCILVCSWMISRRGLGLTSKRFWFALAVGFATGIQSPYYTNLFLQFTGFAFLAQVIRRSPREKILAPAAVAAAAICGFLLMNLDTLYYQHLHGKNPAAVERNYAGLEIYALKPVDLIMPPRSHRIKVMRKVAESYGAQVAFLGEGFQSAYLGVAGISAFAWLLWISVSNALGRPRRPVPGPMMEIIWIAAYSVVGGLNCLLGLAGLQLFRGTNRFSIWILAILLLFLVRQLNRLGRHWPMPVRAVAAFLLYAAAVYDQIPKVPDNESLAASKAVIDSDRGLVEKLSSAVPQGAMIFQLPVVDFPESPPLVEMADYSHLRPYFFSQGLRYSYGNDKGRADDGWQHEVAGLAPAEMVERLEASGFSAIWINRQGYADNGKALIDGLRDAGRTDTIESQQGDLVCVLLNPSAHPAIPNPAH